MIDYEESSIIVYLVLLIPVVAYASYRLVNHYAEDGTPKYAYLSLYVGFFTTLLVTLLVPIDVGCTMVLRTGNFEPIAHYRRDRAVFLGMYEGLYVFILIWGNVVMYYFEYYNTDGYFTTGARARSAMIRLTIDYIPFIVAGGIGLGVILGLKVCPPTSAGLSTFSKIATNAAYETLLMFLIGFGLVEFPRLLWSMGSSESMLQKQQIKAATEFATMMEMQMGLAKHVADALKTKERLSSSNPMVQEAMSILIAECPSEFRSSKQGEMAADKDGNVTIDTLSKLRTKLNSAKSVYRMAQARLEQCQMGAYDLEDIVEAQKSNSKTIHWSLKNAEGSPEECRWLIKHRPVLYKGLSLLAALISLFCFLGVIGSMTPQTINASVYFHMVHSPLKPNLGGITLAVYLQMIYPILVSVWSLFQLRSLGLELVKHRTTPNALSFGCRIIMGLSFPLIFFYLAWIAENGLNDGPWMHVDVPVLLNTNTTDPTDGKMIFVEGTEHYYMPPSFAVFYALATIPFIKRTFSSIFPILLFGFLFMILSQMWNRLMVMAKMPTYQFGDPIVSEEQLAEGMKQLARFKKIAERTVQRKELTKMREMKGADEVDPGLKVCGIWIRRPVVKEKERRSSLTSGTLRFPPPPALHGSGRLKLPAKGRMKYAWTDMYMTVKAPGTLYFCEDEHASEQDPPQVASSMPTPVPLLIVVDFAVGTKKEKDGYRLLIHTHGEIIKVRLESEEDVFAWKKRLLEWKDYAVLLDNLGAGKGDGSKGSGGGGGDDDDGGEFGDIEMGNMTENPMMEGKKKGVGGEESKDGSSPKKKSKDDKDEGKASPTKGEGADPSANFDSLADKIRKEQSLTPEQRKEKKATAVRLARMNQSTDVDAVEAPPPITGWLSKKRASQMLFDNLKYQRRYFRIDEQLGKLAYFLSEFDDEPARDSIDLKLAEPIAMFGKEGKQDDCRFNVIADDGRRVMKLKADTPKEARVWVAGLNRWRDYLLIRYGNAQHAVMSPHGARKAKAKEKAKMHRLLMSPGAGSSSEADTTTTDTEITSGETLSSASAVSGTDTHTKSATETASDSTLDSPGAIDAAAVEPEAESEKKAEGEDTAAAEITLNADSPTSADDATDGSTHAASSTPTEAEVSNLEPPPPKSDKIDDETSDTK